MGFFVNKLRTFFWTIFYYALRPFFFDQMGRSCRFEGWIDIPQRGGRINIGHGVRVNRGTEFSVPKGGVLDINDHASIGKGALLSAHCHIEIGQHTMLAEYVCIHDNNHANANDSPIYQQGFSATPVILGDNCWLGAHVIVLEGAGIGNDSILGAGAVLVDVLSDGIIAAGVPARILKNR